MSRQAITIPAAGEEKRFFLTGKSVIVESGSIYKDASRVPILSFNSGSVEKPIYPQSTYNFECKKFDSIVVKGTEDSAGDVFYLYTTNDLLPEDIQIQFSSRYKTEPGTTFTKTANDGAQSLSELDLLNADGDLPVKLYISVAPTGEPGDGIKWAINADPVQGDNSLGTQLTNGAAGQLGVLEIEDISWMLAFRYIAKTNAERPVINFTPEY